MSEPSPAYELDDDIAVQQAHNGRWAWVDEGYDGAGTRVIEWIEIIDLAESTVAVEGVKHLRFSATDSNGEGHGGDETHWLQSSHWMDTDEMR